MGFLNLDSNINVKHSFLSKNVLFFNNFSLCTDTYQWVSVLEFFIFFICCAPIKSVCSGVLCACVWVSVCVCVPPFFFFFCCPRVEANCRVCFIVIAFVSLSPIVSLYCPAFTFPSIFPCFFRFLCASRIPLLHHYPALCPTSLCTFNLMTEKML